MSTPSNAATPASTGGTVRAGEDGAPVTAPKQQGTAPVQPSARPGDPAGKQADVARHARSEAQAQPVPGKPDRTAQAARTARKNAAAAVTAASKAHEWIRTAGVYIVWSASVGLSFTALYGLARDLGWSRLTAPLFVAVLDIYWLTSLQCMLDRNVARGKRAAAAFHGAVALLLSAIGNLLYHELDDGQWHLGHHAPLVVAIASTVPLVAAVAVTHLATLIRSSSRTTNGSGSRNQGNQQNQNRRGSRNQQGPQNQNQPTAGNQNQNQPMPAPSSPGSAPAGAPVTPVPQRPLGPRSIGELQLQALEAVAAHRAQTGRRMNNAELGRAIQVSKKLAGELRLQIADREEGAA
jgi:hypothetical protein